MIAKLSYDLMRELEQAGDEPLPVENPLTKRVYVLVDAERYNVIPRANGVAGSWTESKNARRCALIRKKFTQGIEAAEATELSVLQGELSDFRKRTVPVPYDVINALQEALSPSPESSSAPAT